VQAVIDIGRHQRSMDSDSEFVAPWGYAHGALFRQPAVGAIFARYASDM
jgi:hypothetical protein